VNRLFGFGLGKCCDCACCGGGACECVPFVESWNTTTEWSFDGPVTTSGGAVSSTDGAIRVGERPTGCVFNIVSELDPNAGAIDGGAQIVILSPNGALFISATWRVAETSWRWFYAWNTPGDGIGQTEVFPSNPDEAHGVRLQYNQAGEWSLSITGLVEITTGTDFSSISGLAVQVFGDGAVEAIVADCEQYVPDPLYGIWLTQDNQPWLTQDNQPWLMQYA